MLRRQTRTRLDGKNPEPSLTAPALTVRSTSTTLHESVSPAPGIRDPGLFGIAGFGLEMAGNTLIIVGRPLNLRAFQHHIVAGGEFPRLKFKNVCGLRSLRYFEGNPLILGCLLNLGVVPLLLACYPLFLGSIAPLQQRRVVNVCGQCCYLIARLFVAPCNLAKRAQATLAHRL